MSQFINNLKRSIAMITAMCLVLLQGTSHITFASMSVEDNEHFAIITKKLEKYGREFNIYGKINETVAIPDMHGGIVSMLGKETEVFDDSHTISMTDYVGENNMYSKALSINCDTSKLTGIIMSEGDITVNARLLTADDFTVLYSKSGSININVSQMNFRGLIYVPNGNVVINGISININGCIVAKDTKLYVDTMSVVANEYTDNIMNVFSVFRDDKILTLTGYTYEEDIVLGFETDTDIKSVDIYIRNDDAAKFEYFDTTTELEYTIKEYEFEQYMDIMAIATTPYGDKFDSTLMTVGYSNDEYAEKLASYCNDTDEDGIQDGYEVWYSKTNPNVSDTDGDGVSDYAECFILCTDPNVDNANVDTDKDGISDIAEIVQGTHPYLKDTDFDGFLDLNDKEPLTYNSNTEAEVDYTENRVIGLFDKVETWIDDNGNVYQNIYNFINDNTQYTMVNGVITKYYYNIYNQLIAVVTINGDVMDAVTYTYNGEVLSAVAYNGFLYEFSTKENGENITIAGQSYKDVVYGNDDYVTTTYGNDFEVKTKMNENGEIEEVFYNGELVLESRYDENGQVQYVKDYISGLEQTYSYDETGSIDMISSDNYTIEYEYSDEEYTILYDILGQTYKQVVYNDLEDKYASQYSSLLISGDLHENVEVSDNVVEYKISDTINGDIIYSNIVTYTDSLVTNIQHNDGNCYEIVYLKDGKIGSILQNNDEMIKYTYDNLGRLVREDNGLIGKSYEYKYNSDNNITSKCEYCYTTGELGIILEEETYSYENTWKDQVTNISGDKISYDEIGNPINYRDGINFDWDGKLLSGASTNGCDLSFTYNHEGIRTSKTVNGLKKEFVIEGKDIIFEVCDDYTLAFIYDSDMNVIGMIYDENTYYFEKSVQNDVVKILDETGDVVCEYIYDAWGNVVSISGDEVIARLNPFRYRSYYYDNETGLYYVESRYYDPQTGRFINADKIEAIIWDYTNLNMYAYCGNDPVNYYDPSGEAAIYIRTFISRDIFESSTYGPEANSLLLTNSIWLSNNKSSGSQTRYIIDSKEDFIDSWNSIQKATIIMINAHGIDYKSMSFSGDEFTVEDVKKLKEIDVEFVWLLSCIQGHYSYCYNTMANALSQRIKDGVVIAADGIMAVDIINGRYSPVSQAIGEWKKYAGSRNYSYGWILYRYGLCKTNALYPLFGTMQEGYQTAHITIYELSDFLVKSNYISYK